MSYFKFECPRCTARIEVGVADEGRQFDCPDCQETITVPKPPAAGDPPQPKAPAPARPQPAPLPELTPASPPAEPAAGEESQAKPDTTAAIFELTPAIRLQLVTKAREHIADPGRWTRGIGENDRRVLAARMEDGKTVPLKITNPDATHFSIVGALLRGMDELNVLLTASGRSDFLHDDLEGATARVILRALPADASEEDKAKTAGTNPLTLTHEQCLAVLQEMQSHYVKRERQEASDAAPKLDTSVTLEQLLARGEDSLPGLEVAKAALVELQDLRSQLADLELRVKDLTMKLSA